MVTIMAVIISALITIAASWLLFHCPALTIGLIVVSPIGIIVALLPCAAGKAQAKS